MVEVHLNRPEHLPPVGCPLLIGVGDMLLRVERTWFIEDRTRMMEYVTEDGRKITGRYYWTYP